MHAPLLVALAALLPLTAAEPVRTGSPGPQVARVLPLAPIAPDGKICPSLSRHATGDRRGAGIWREFGGGPPVEPHLAVVRLVDGCPVPVIAGASRP